MSQQIDSRGSENPNVSYDIIEKHITSKKEIYLPVKIVRLNRHKHKIKNWMTSDILKAITHRDRIYKQMLTQKRNSDAKSALKINLYTCNKILKKDISEAKKIYYFNEFKKHINDIKNTWNILKDILNSQVNKSTFPKHFLIGNVINSNDQEIANQFNNYFTDIGQQLANTIDSENKYPFQHYLRTPCGTNFQFSNINSTDVLHIINELKPKNSAGHDLISCKLLKEIRFIISEPLAMVINQTLITL